MAKWKEGPELDAKICGVLTARTGKELFTPIPVSQDLKVAFAAINLLRSRWGFVIKTIEPLNKSQIRWSVELFDGEPIIANGVGGTSNYREYHGSAFTLPMAICYAILAMDDGEKFRESCV